MIDLGCAPGGWLQVLLERGAGAVAGVDLLPVDPIAPVELIEGDFTDPGVAARLAALVGGAADLILSDMAPNTTGHRKTDHLRIVGLIEVGRRLRRRDPEARRRLRRQGLPGRRDRRGDRAR